MEGATANDLPGMLPVDVREARRARFMEVAEEVSAQRLQRRVGQAMKVIVDKAEGLGKKGGVGRTYADAPEIDGVVHIQPPEKASKTYKTGGFDLRAYLGCAGPRFGRNSRLTTKKRACGACLPRVSFAFVVETSASKRW